MLYRTGTKLMVTGAGKLASSTTTCPCPTAADVVVTFSGIIHCDPPAFPWGSSPNQTFDNFAVGFEDADLCRLDDSFTTDANWDCWLWYEKTGADIGKITDLYLRAYDFEESEGYTVFHFDDTTGENPILNDLVVGQCGDPHAGDTIDGHSGQGAWSY